MNTIQQVLVTFNGDRDPTPPAAPSQDGPVLTLLKAREIFAKVILFFTPNLEARAGETARIIQERYPRTLVVCRSLDIEDPTSYSDILKALRPALRELCPPVKGTEYHICVSPGTPQIHACWLLMAASGEITARILQVKNPKDVREGQELVREIHPRGPEFPDVVPRIRMEEVPEIGPAEMEQAIREAGIVGKDPQLLKALEDAGRVAQYDRASILILGESGTGKELFAKYIHQIGKRRSRPLITVNCSGFPETLIESELFGYVKGAFTGANEDRKGIFHVANNGTLFMDEIGDMALSAQAKVLRALNDGEITRVGASKAELVNVRIIAATNKDIYVAMKLKTFREDLYYRLAEQVIRLPSLVERQDDIPIIAQELVRRCNMDFVKNVSLSQNCLSFLQSLAWPGNIRELRNVIKRSVMLARKDVIEPEAIIFDRPGTSRAAPWIPELHKGFSMDAYLTEARTRIMDRALEMAGGNQSRAASLLGVTSQAISQYVSKKKGE